MPRPTSEDQLTSQELHAVRVGLAKEEIREVLNRYCRGVDRADQELIRSIYHPDGIDLHGKLWSESGYGFAAMLAEVLPVRMAAMHHTICNSLIEFEDDVAWVESYFIATYRERTEPGAISTLGGRYLDRFELRDGRWLIATRKVIADWSTRHCVPPDPKRTADMPSGRLDRGDPLYNRASWSLRTGPER